MSAHGNATVTAGRVPCAAECTSAGAGARVPRFDRNVTTNGLLSDSTGSLSGRFSYTILSSLSHPSLALYLQSFSYTRLSFTSALSSKNTFFFFLFSFSLHFSLL